jgi:hypothetical protein
MHVDEVGFEVDVVPVEGLEFACAEAGVEGGGIDGAVGGLERVEERAELGGGGDAFAASSDGGKSEFEGRVDRDLASLVGAAEDRAEREEGVADAACGESFGGELVGEVLQHQVRDRGQSFGAEVGEGAVVERLPVGPDRGGLVGLAASRAHPASLGRLKPLPGRVIESGLGG